MFTLSMIVAAALDWISQVAVAQQGADLLSQGTLLQVGGTVGFLWTDQFSGSNGFIYGQWFY